MRKYTISPNLLDIYLGAELATLGGTALETVVAASASSSFPSTASLISEMVLSRLRLLVLGLVMVVPRLAWRPCPRLNGDVDGMLTVEDAELGVGGRVPPEMTSSRAAATPLAGMGAEVSSAGDGGLVIIARPSSESASYRSGGRRSFSMSDLRLVYVNNGISHRTETHVRIVEVGDSILDSFCSRS